MLLSRRFALSCFGWGSSAGGLDHFAPDTSRLTAEVAEVEESSAANFASAHHFKFVDPGAVEQEGSLHADVVRDFTDRERRTGAVAFLATNNEPFEDLDTFFGAFNDLSVNFDRISGAKIRDVALEDGAFDRFDDSRSAFNA